MTDAELVEQILLLRNTDQPYTDKRGVVDVKAQIMDEIKMVREHDTTIPDRMRRIDKLIQVERAKVKAEHKAALIKMHDECGGLSLHYALKALDTIE